MPLVRISLPQHTVAADAAAVATAIHNALVATFNVPEADQFQAVHRHSPEELVCTLEFLGIQQPATWYWYKLAALRAVAWT